ncbi:putative mitogen-activated protein kinase organizer 1 [Podospora fimiseda]|uniref:Mitogen-activated protein kinase organizer 1 n=1 Tax=Podospora fimiseda TaxID=252190 RepID=A0AAN7BSQ9_9PEZI|nr:putative mitogen-activated protein kinase organizer 1 [Podospora fimiseda]
MAEFPSRPVAQLVGSNGPIHALTYSSPPSTYILTGSSDRSIRLYNPSSYTPSPSPSSPLPQGKLIQTYTSHAYEVLSLSISSTNDKFASSGGDRTLFLWDVQTSSTSPLRRFHSHSGRINTVIFSGQDDSLLISGGIDCSVRIWDIRSSNSQKAIQVLSEAKDAITSLVSTGHEIMTGSVDGRIRTYDLRMGRCITDVMPGPVTSLTLSRDEKTILVSTLDSKIRLMDRKDGRMLKGYEDREFRNEELRVRSLIDGKGERWVLSGDENEGRVWVWGLMTGEVVKRLDVPEGTGGGKKVVVGKDGRIEKKRKNVISCLAWGGEEFCVAGSEGVVTVFGQ